VVPEKDSTEKEKPLTLPIAEPADLSPNDTVIDKHLPPPSATTPPREEKVEKEKSVREGDSTGSPPAMNALKNFTVFINGFHLDPADPCHQVEAQHYCQELNDDLTQCILFDKHGHRLQGVEYIVSRELFSKLPMDERVLWHSHRFEVLYIFRFNIITSNIYDLPI